MDHYTSANYLLTENLGISLIRARNLVASDLGAALKHLDITHLHMDVLLSLWLGTASAPAELSKVLDIDGGYATRLLDRLEEKGLIERSRSAVDRRVVNLALTEVGRSVAAQLPEITPKVLNARLQNFTADEFYELCRLLRKFTNN